jgi:hypothetical protein
MISDIRVYFRNAMSTLGIKENSEAFDNVEAYMGYLGWIK